MLIVLAKNCLYMFKNKIISFFMIFVAKKMVGQKRIFPPPLMVLLLEPELEFLNSLWGLGTEEE
jgi:hypothetical protein